MSYNKIKEELEGLDKQINDLYEKQKQLNVEMFSHIEDKLKEILKDTIWTIDANRLMTYDWDVLKGFYNLNKELGGDCQFEHWHMDIAPGTYDNIQFSRYDHEFYITNFVDDQELIVFANKYDIIISLEKLESMKKDSIKRVSYLETEIKDIKQKVNRFTNDKLKE